MMPYWHDAIIRTWRLAGRCWSRPMATRCARWSSTWTASGREIAGLNIPTGIPLVYELDPGFRPPRRRPLPGPGSGRGRGRRVASQGR